MTPLEEELALQLEVRSAGTLPPWLHGPTAAWAALAAIAAASSLLVTNKALADPFWSAIFLIGVIPLAGLVVFTISGHPGTWVFTSIAMVLGVVERYAGTYSVGRDAVCAALALAITVFLRRESRIAARAITHGAVHLRRASRLGAITFAAVFLGIDWALISVVDPAMQHRYAAVPVRRAPMGAPNDPALVMALSGGGYRAALFHAGVLSALAQTGAHPAAMSAVSGGSIIGSYVAVGGDPRAFLEVVGHGRLNVKREITHIQHFVPLVIGKLRGFVDGQELFTRTEVQASLLSKMLLGSATISEARSPNLIVNATDVLNNAAIGFTPEGILVQPLFNQTNWHELNPPPAADNDVHPSAPVLAPEPTTLSLARLVAASGAFPGAFRPVRASLAGATRVLSDGGLADNSGILALSDMTYLARVANRASRLSDSAESRTAARESCTRIRDADNAALTCYRALGAAHWLREWPGQRPALVLVSDGSAQADAVDRRDELSELLRSIGALFRNGAAQAIAYQPGRSFRDHVPRLVISAHVVDSAAVAQWVGRSTRVASTESGLATVRAASQFLNVSRRDAAERLGYCSALSHAEQLHACRDSITSLFLHQARSYAATFHDVETLDDQIPFVTAERVYALGGLLTFVYRDVIDSVLQRRSDVRP
jgi:predicted acylesterase/phospholipase RssA